MPALRPLTDVHPHGSGVVFRVAPEGIIVVAGTTRQRHVYAANPADWALYADHIAPHADAISDRDAVTLSYLLYQYCLRIANTKAMRRCTTTVSHDTITTIRESLFAHHHLVQYKIATLRCVVHRLNPTTDMHVIAEHFEACGLRAENAVLFAMLYYTNDLTKFVDAVATIPDREFTLEVNALRCEIERDPSILREFNKTAGYFTYKKLDFIVRGNRFSHNDPMQDLRERAIQSYYWVRPFYTREHAINYAKRAVYKHAINMIAYYNHPSRARTFQIGDTGHFDNTIVQFSDYLPGPPETVNHTEDAMVEYIDHLREQAQRA